MTFIEFIEAVVRVAEKVEIPNLMTDQGSLVGMEIDEKQKEVYAKRPLASKVESFVLYLAKVNLKPPDYGRLCQRIRDFREDDRIRANDIEIGNMRMQ